MPDSPIDSSSNETLAAEIDRLRGELDVVAAALANIYRHLRRGRILDSRSTDLTVNINEGDSYGSVSADRHDGRQRFVQKLSNQISNKSLDS